MLPGELKPQLNHPFTRRRQRSSGTESYANLNPTAHEPSPRVFAFQNIDRAVLARAELVMTVRGRA